jgi:peptide/nickel transport system permease protein
MSATAGTPLSAAALTRRRRVQSLRRNWRLFRAHRSGLLGLGILLFFIALAVFAPLLVDRDGLDLTKATGGVLEHPSSTYWLGTDDSGRPILTQLVFGSRVSLFVGLFATLISMLIGTVVGLLSGFLEGWGARVLFRLTEWFLVLPFLPLALSLATILRRCRSGSGPTSSGPGSSAPAGGTRSPGTPCPTSCRWSSPTPR